MDFLTWKTWNLNVLFTFFPALYFGLYHIIKSCKLRAVVWHSGEVAIWGCPHPILEYLFLVLDAVLLPQQLADAYLGRQQMLAQTPGSLSSIWEAQWVLGSWPSPDYCRHLRFEPVDGRSFVLSASVPVFLLFKLKNENLWNFNLIVGQQVCTQALKELIVQWKRQISNNEHATW